MIAKSNNFKVYGSNTTKGSKQYRQKSAMLKYDFTVQPEDYNVYIVKPKTIRLTEGNYDWSVKPVATCDLTDRRKL